MKKIFVPLSLISLLYSGSIALQSCHNKAADSSTTTTTNTTAVDTSTAPTTAPVTVSNDDALKTGITNATKDYPGVKADVNNGEIKLSGEIKRDKLPALMQALNSLRPKKIINNLTVKP